MIRALFLDAAGTLIEPAEPVAAVYARAAAAHGLELTSEGLKQAFRSVFASLPDPDWSAYPDQGDAAERAWWREVVRRTLETAAGQSLPTQTLDACFAGLFAHYEDPSAWTVFPEVPAILAIAGERGWKTAVVSNFDRRLHRILAGHGLEFDAVVTSADARSRKPDAAIFRMALDLLGVQPFEVIHLGDSSTADFSGAGRLGIRAALVERPAQDLASALAAALEKVKSE